MFKSVKQGLGDFFIGTTLQNLDLFNRVFQAVDANPEPSNSFSTVVSPNRAF